VPDTLRSASFYRRLQIKLRRKTVRRRAVRFGLVASNVVILGIIAVFVLQNPKTDNLAAPSLSSATATQVANPLDQVSSADIALTVARMGQLPETTAVTNQAQSEAADVAIAASNNNVVSKPQVVATALKSSADIKDYTAVAGDTVSTIAAKFNVTSDSVRWSNNMTGEAVSAGSHLVIPPVNGIVYTVNAGDTPDSLAAKFHTNRDQIIAYNDAEVNGLRVGSRILIPNGNKTASVLQSGAFTAQYGGNGYDYGYCTWYVAKRLPVPANWGNANSWAYYAALSGWKVSKTPVPGAIAQSSGGYFGHVAVVEAVLPDGSIQYSDMNGLAGWNHVGTGTTSANHFQHYIYR